MDRGKYLIINTAVSTYFDIMYRGKTINYRKVPKRTLIIYYKKNQTILETILIFCVHAVVLIRNFYFNATGSSNVPDKYTISECTPRISYQRTGDLGERRRACKGTRFHQRGLL